MDNIAFEKINPIRDKIIFLDIDGTLIADDGGLEFSPGVLDKINSLKRNNRVFLCTNSNDRIKSGKIEAALGLPIATYDHKKPSSKIISKLGIGKGNRNLLVIGDKFLTDWLFAKNIGAGFLKTARKVSGKESSAIKLINFFDDAVWQIMEFLKII